MREYTSLEVSKRLKAAGFDLSRNFENVEHMYGGDVQDEDYDSSLEGVYGYRSDTLLTWLLAKGWRCDEQYRDSACYVLADLYGDYSPIHRHEEANALTLPDALAEVVMKVLGFTGGAHDRPAT